MVTEIKIWKRKGKHRTSLYLKWWDGATRKWTYEKLAPIIRPGKEYQQRNADALELAKKLRDMRQSELQFGQHGLIAPHRRRGDFVSYFENLIVADDSKRKWHSILTYLKEYVPQGILFSAIDENFLKGFQNFLIKKVKTKTLKQNSIWLFESKIRAALKMAFKEKFLPRDICPFVKPISYKQRERVFLTVDEIKKLMATPCRRDDVGRAFLFSVFSGLRLSDIRSLTGDNITSDGFIRKWIDKTETFDTFPLTEWAKKYLPEKLHKEKLIFPLPGENTVNDNLRSWTERAGISKHVTFHCARHSYAFLLLSKGVNIYDVQRALGHKSIVMTEVYAHQLPQDLKIKVEKALPAFDLDGEK